MDCRRAGRRRARPARPTCSRAMDRQCATRSRRADSMLRDIYDEHAGLQDRFRDCGGRDAGRSRAQLGLTGLAGRASGVRGDLRCDFPGRPTTRSTCRCRCGRAATSRHASRCASTRCSNRCGSCRAIIAACPTARSRVALAGAAPRSPRRRVCRGLARPVLRRAGNRPAADDPALPSARSVVAELAGARARGDRQHRSGFSADQQVVQPVVQRTRPVR